MMPLEKRLGRTFDIFGDHQDPSRRSLGAPWSKCLDLQDFFFWEISYIIYIDSRQNPYNLTFFFYIRTENQYQVW